MAANPSPDPVPSRQDGPIVLAIAALVVVTVAIGAIAPNTSHKPAAAEVVLLDSDPACAEWSDGCRVCKRLAGGPVCSTPGIACTPGPQECLHRTTSP